MSSPSPVNRSFRIECEITHSGSADYRVSDGEKEAVIWASYLMDTQPDFATAVELVVSGAPRVEFFMAQEPGETVWIFAWAGDRIELRIEDRYKGIKVLFEAHVDPIELVVQAESVLDNLLDRWEEDKYLEEWGWPFPSNEHNRLKVLHHRLRLQALTDALAAIGESGLARLFDCSQVPRNRTSEYWVNDMWEGSPRIFNVEDKAVQQALLEVCKRRLRWSSNTRAARWVERLEHKLSSP